MNSCGAHRFVAHSRLEGGTARRELFGACQACQNRIELSCSSGIPHRPRWWKRIARQRPAFQARLGRGCCVWSCRRTRLFGRGQASHSSANSRPLDFSTAIRHCMHLDTIVANPPAAPILLRPDSM
eukprot:scaffold109473_cov33-Tisochrysis_lutea.AAC.6